jgi:hypothetical protein
VSDSLNHRLDELRGQLNLLPEAEEPPPTTLQALGQGTREQAWQRLLFHFLSSTEAHGFGHDLLEHFLSELAGCDDLEYTFSRFDLPDIQIETEVVTSNDRRPDAVIWFSENWFICCELKIASPEGDDQTRDYVDADSFDSIELDKDDVQPDDRHYIYIAPKDQIAPDDATSPEAEEFVPVTWEWVASTFESFLISSQGKYPARTTAQFNEFIGTIQSELIMTEYEETQQDKVELYFDYYDEITDVQQAFTDRWDEFTANWGVKLAHALDGATIIEDASTPEDYVLAEIPLRDGERRQWVFRQNHSTWGMIFPREWWTKLDEGIQIADSPKPNARVGFVHRLGDRYRPVAIEDHQLKFWLRNARAGHDAFVDSFAGRFNSDEEITETLPRPTSRTGNQINVLEATYSINVESHDDFFEAYIDALASAIDDHVLSNPELVRKVDTLYHDVIDQDTEFEVPDAVAQVVTTN